MSLVSSWKPLVSTRHETGELLVRFDLSGDVLFVFLTDLRTIWAERLDVQGTARRARQHGSPIDPDGGPGQRRRLVERVAGALQGEEGSTLQLTHSKGGSGLLLSLGARLPAPLPRLQWSFELIEQAGESVLDELTGPAVEKIYRQERDVEDLLAILKEKDHVISRLFDRLEVLSTDITSIFPGTTNVRIPKGTSARSQLARYVKGLHPFDMDNWARSTSVLSDLTEIGAAFSGTNTLSSTSVCAQLTVPINLAPSPGQVAASPDEASGTQMGTDLISAASPNARSDTDTESEDDVFQVQRTTGEVGEKTEGLGPGATVRSSNVKSGGALLSTTIRSRARLDMIGGSKPKFDIANDDASSDAGTSHVASTADLTTEDSTISSVPTRKKPRLGIIGGKQLRVSAEADSPMLHDEKGRTVVKEGQTIVEEGQTIVKEGQIVVKEGSRPRPPHAPAEIPTIPSHVRGRTAAAKPSNTSDSPPVIQETPEEGAHEADRRRAELKALMIASTTDSSHKKKRKF